MHMHTVPDESDNLHTIHKAFAVNNRINRIESSNYVTFIMPAHCNNNIIYPHSIRSDSGKQLQGSSHKNLFNIKNVGTTHWALLQLAQARTARSNACSN